MSALLTAERLELAYGEISACRDVSFHVDAGEIVTLIGANGAGKSTTLRAIAGALLPRTGAIRFRGEDITRLPSYEYWPRDLACPRRSACFSIPHGA